MFRLLVLLALLSTVADARFKYTKQTHLPKINLLDNPGWENHKTGWTKSGGVYTLETSTHLMGGASGQWNPSATSQTFTSDAAVLPKGMYGRDCELSFIYSWDSGTAGEIQFYVWDGTNALHEKVDLVPTSSPLPEPARVAFTCPSSGSIYARLESTADADEITLDDFWLGSNLNNFDYLTAERVGTKRWAATSGCAWTKNADNWDEYAADVQCDDNTRTFTGQAIADATIDGQKPKIRFAGLDSGDYRVVFTGGMNADYGTGTTVCRYAITDGTTRKEVTHAAATNNAQINAVPSVEADFTYDTAQGDTTYTLIVYGDPDGDCFTTGIYAGLAAAVYRYPLESQKATTIDMSKWYVDASIGGANIDMGNSTITTYTAPDNSGLDLVVNDGSASVGIGCSGTNENDVGDLTCSAGNEQIAIVLNIPQAGAYEFEFTLAHKAKAARAVFELVETGNANQTIVQEGNTRLTSWNGTTSDMVFPIVLTGLFKFDSAGKKTIRLMREQDRTLTSNLIYADRETASGQRDIHITVKPWLRGYSQPYAIPQNKWQTRILQSNFTSASATVTGLTFDNLTPGKTYKIFPKFYFRTTSGRTPDYQNGVSMYDGGTKINGMTSQVVVISSHWSSTDSAPIIWTMNGSTITFVSSSITNSTSYYAGDGTRDQTYVTVIECNECRETDEWTP